MKLTYRPEIDGLRAIAVGAVILYHAQITILGYQPFKGGFIGVDIFFVISGYLITSIILKELVTTGSFSFKHFYERRIKRILPALLFVMLVSLPLAWIYLLPYDLIDFSKSILYSLGFSSNFYFHYSGLEYAVDNLSNPFLHTWSLSVEEQYYILFPIVLLITFKYFKKNLIHILIFGFAISLVLSEWSSRNYPSLSFYFIHTRMWELLAGSILAYFEIIKGHRSQNQTLNFILPGIGLILIGHSILFFNDEMYHPSFYTLSPIIGVCLIIWFSNKDEIITKILSTKLFVGIGLISYSLYLWHYPVFAFERITEFSNNNILKQLFPGIIILVLSVITYYFIERPFRYRNYNFNILIITILSCVFILILVNFIFIKHNGFSERYPSILSKNLTHETYGFESLIENLDGIKCNINKSECKFNLLSQKKIYLIGDSHMASLVLDFKNKITKKDFQLITSTVSGCIFFPGFNKISRKTGKINNSCNNEYFIKLAKTLSNDNNSIIIFGGRFPLYLSEYAFDNQEGGIEDHGNEEKVDQYYSSIGKYKEIGQSFAENIEKLSFKNKIILIYPIPETGYLTPDKLRKKIKHLNKNDLNAITNFLKKEKLTTSYKVYQERTKKSFELLDSIEGKNVYRVYPHKLFCNTQIENRCLTHDKDDIFYADEHHPSPKGAEMINDLIMKEIEKIELKSN